jgi:3-oxoacid CoA-transferase subunit B
LLDVTDHGLVVRELHEGVTLEQVQRITEPRLRVDSGIRKMEY